MACKKNYLLISESERVYIKNLYNLLTEDEKEEFEDYFLKNKLVEKTPDGMYKVIVNKITYASNPYSKNTILKLN